MCQLDELQKENEDLQRDATALRAHQPVLLVKASIAFTILMIIILIVIILVPDMTRRVPLPQRKKRMVRVVNPQHPSMTHKLVIAWVASPFMIGSDEKIVCLKAGVRMVRSSLLGGTSTHSPCQ